MLLDHNMDIYDSIKDMLSDPKLNLISSIEIRKTNIAENFIKEIERYVKRA